jgi:hypothetical protein
VAVHQGIPSSSSTQRLKKTEREVEQYETLQVEDPMSFAQDSLLILREIQETKI